MKYCPYCGADVLSGSVSFCAECGKSLNGDIKEKPKKHKKKKEKKTDKTFAKEQFSPEVYEEATEPEPEPTPDPDFGYDGYYDDVLPADDTVERQQLDKATVKNLIIIAVGVFLAITICVIAIYLM